MAIAIELAIALAALLVENEHLLTLNERRYYFAYYLGAFYSRSTYLYVAVVVNQQHVVKFNSLAVFGAADVVYIELLALFCFELLTVNLYDCVHLKNNINGFFREANNTMLLLFLAYAD